MHACTDTAHLLLGGRAHVKTVHDRARLLRDLNGGETGNAGADDEHLGRGDLACVGASEWAWV